MCFQYHLPTAAAFIPRTQRTPGEHVVKRGAHWAPSEERECGEYGVDPYGGLWVVAAVFEWVGPAAAPGEIEEEDEEEYQGAGAAAAAAAAA